MCLSFSPLLSRSTVRNQSARGPAVMCTPWMGQSLITIVSWSPCEAPAGGSTSDTTAKPSARKDIGNSWTGDRNVPLWSSEVGQGLKHSFGFILNLWPWRTGLVCFANFYYAVIIPQWQNKKGNIQRDWPHCNPSQGIQDSCAAKS